jgi:hypothetical protein
MLTIWWLSITQAILLIQHGILEIGINLVESFNLVE